MTKGCHNLSTEPHIFHCSNCDTVVTITCNYCPTCGCKVCSEGEEHNLAIVDSWNNGQPVCPKCDGTNVNYYDSDDMTHKIPTETWLCDDCGEYVFAGYQVAEVWIL